VTLHSSPDPEGWLPFLKILAKSFDEVRAAGGVGQLWAATGQHHLELQEIDYADILRERDGASESKWDDIIRACLNPDVPLDDERCRGCSRCGDPEARLVLALEQNSETGMASVRPALFRCAHVIDLVSPPIRGQFFARRRADLPPCGRCSRCSRQGPGSKANSLVLPDRQRMTDTCSPASARRGIPGGASTGSRRRSGARADGDKQPGLLNGARSPTRRSAAPRTFDVWKNAATCDVNMTAVCAESYARELSEARTQALEVERVSDDPPERIGRWVSSVGPVEVRALDLQLLLDLLTIEADPGRWQQVTAPVVGHIEDCLLVGDFDAAVRLAAILAEEAKQDGPRKAAATAALTRLVDGTMMSQVVSHLRSVDDASAEKLNALLHLAGPSVLKALAEALAVDKRTAARQRFTQILLAFGSAGRNAVEQLRASANPAVRRTAIHLLREFGGTEALPDRHPARRCRTAAARRCARPCRGTEGVRRVAARCQRHQSDARELAGADRDASGSDSAVRDIVRKIDRKGHALGVSGALESPALKASTRSTC
jgi:hypothetical protein